MTLTEKLRQALARDPYWWLRVANIQETECGEDGVYRVIAGTQSDAKTLHTFTWSADYADGRPSESGIKIEIRIDPESIRRFNEALKQHEKYIRSQIDSWLAGE